MKYAYFIFVTSVFLYITGVTCSGQCPSSGELWEKIKESESSNSSPSQKLSYLYVEKKVAESCGLQNDSSYALILLKIALYEYPLNYDYAESIKFAETALKINKGIKAKGSVLINVMAYSYLGYFAQNLMLYKNALNYYDSGIVSSQNFADSNFYGGYCYFNKVIIYITIGDYQKAADESTVGINCALSQKDTFNYVSLLNLRSQSYLFQNDFKNAINDVKIAMLVAQKTENISELANSYKKLGYIYEKQNKNDSALYFFNACLKVHLLHKSFTEIAKDYNDLGNFYLNNLSKYQTADQCYNQTLVYADKMQDPLSSALEKAEVYTNLGENSLLQNKFNDAENFFLKAFDNLHMHVNGSILKNISSIELNKCVYKNLIINLMNNRTNFLLEKFKSSHSGVYLEACMQSALVTDSLTTQVRHEQFGELSKLYWRDQTRDFYETAIEACYLAHNANFAFYFMEKSRAVLLNDKLNELAASNSLSSEDALKRKAFARRIVELEQKLFTLNDSSKQYQNMLQELLSVKNEYEQFTKLLEQKYPVYYQYKYTDEVPTLQGLQQYLAKNNQSFVHYFMGDTATYILAITPSNTRLIRLSQKDFDKKQLSQFLQLCSNKEMLNNHFNSFAGLSNSIYKSIFQSLDLPKGRIIICSDRIIIPFEALCTDADGKNFLLNNYSFSYVYSARFLMKQFKGAVSTGNFIGFAPVSYAKYLDVNDLKKAGKALQASASYYKKNKLFTEDSASKHNFFNYASSYSVVSIFSHAQADTTDNEPVLFMQDSLIHLSELQLLNDPATQLVILSACQTNVGKSATGEGIYSLARGFATAGIPSVAATLWKADEQTIYSISARLNEYLSEGMTKDEALRKAKLYFIQKNDDKLLPYYWANMIVIGNGDAINLTTANNSYRWWIVTGIFVALILAFFIFRKKAK